MAYSRKVPATQRVVISYVGSNQSKPRLESLFRPPKANQTLKRYLKKNSNTRALDFFKDLWRRNPSAVDSYTLLFALKACTRESMLVEGRQLHATIKKLGCEPVIFLQTCLIDLYASTTNVECARCMFDEISCKNTICWTSLITAYTQNDMPSKALDMFELMLIDNVEPDQITLTVVLTACAELGALCIGRWIHAYIFRKEGLLSDLALCNAFINMYVKCGDVRSARRLFYMSTQRDVFTWTSMIVGHALHGQSDYALDLFREMKGASNNIKGTKSCVVPNEVTFLGVLMACTHAGMVDEGKRHFKSMVRDFRLSPKLSHLGCMVDLLCRAGLLEEAYSFITQMSVMSNSVMWRTLLGACVRHDNIELGAKIRARLFELEPTHVGDDVALSNLYAANGLWSEKMMVRDRIECRRVPGMSSVEVGGAINEFVAGDSSHPQHGEIYDVLGNLMEMARSYTLVLESSMDVTNY